MMYEPNNYDDSASFNSSQFLEGRKEDKRRDSISFTAVATISTNARQNSVNTETKKIYDITSSEMVHEHGILNCDVVHTHGTLYYL